MKNIANSITLSRIAFSLFLSALPPFTFRFYAVYALCGVSDIIDGIIARKTNTVSAFGSKIDSIADLIFMLVCMLKVFPHTPFKNCIWIWIAVIAIIRVVNIISGFICVKRFISLHTAMNKLTGGLLFIFPFTISFIDVNDSATLICISATFAAVQEGHLIRTKQIFDLDGK